MNRLNLGIPYKLFSAVVSVAGLTSDVMAAPENFKHSAFVLTWRTAFAVNPVAINVSIQQAMNNVAAEFANVDTSTYVTDGEQRIAFPFTGKFIRAIINTTNGGTGVDVEVMLT